MKDAFDALTKEYPRKYIDVLFMANPRRLCDNQPTFRFQTTGLR